MKGWIGVDFDGTLAEMHGLQPIPKMVNRVKGWLKDGKEVRIVTARFPDEEDVVHWWLKKHLGQDLKVTNKKDYAMLELWDDRAVQVIPNTGERADGRG